MSITSCTAIPALRVLDLHHRHSPHGALSAGEIPTICAQHDTRFRRLTERGNQALGASDHGAACSFYGEALEEAQAVFGRACTEGGTAVLVAPMILNIACHNLASARSLTQDEYGARALLVQAVESLTEAAATVTFPLAMRLNCVRHFRHALGFLPDPTEPPTQADLTSKALTERAAAVAAEVVRTAPVYVSSMNQAQDQLC